MTSATVPVESFDPARVGTGRSLFCSWSGGKDSALALHTAVRAGNVISYLLTMMTEDGERSRSHGLSRHVLEQQAASLGVPIMMVSASWERYESCFLSALKKLRTLGVAGGIFGAIDVPEHRAWIERICSIAKLDPVLPLWQRDRTAIMKDLLTQLFEAVIVAVRAKDLSLELLGRALDSQTVMELQRSDIDLCGENGEYHTVVTSAPNFSFPVALGAVAPRFRNGYWVLSH
jgi:uncharacterized protein (TIGR00290 family)